MKKNTSIQKTRKRIRSKVKGTSECPRLAVFRSNSHIYAQIIDDEKGHTITAASSKELGSGVNVETAKEVGKKLAEKASASGVETVVFDRGGYLYHGRIKALAEGAREGGLNF